MSAHLYVTLPERGVLAVSGPDSRSFLQGLISNDVMRVSPDRAIHAALLTAQGRYLHDFFITAIGERLLLDCEAARRDDLTKRLKLYKLRSKVTLEDATEGFAVAALPGADAAAVLGLVGEPGAAKPLGGGVVYVDPRLAAIGARALLPRAEAEATLAGAGFAPAPREAYEAQRLALGLPDGSRDLEVERAILLENGFDELNGVDWKKGCYVGQELTARMKHRGTDRKRLLAIASTDGTPLPACDLPITSGIRELGMITSIYGDRGFALMRLDRLAESAGEPLEVSGVEVEVRHQNWLFT